MQHASSKAFSFYDNLWRIDWKNILKTEIKHSITHDSETHRDVTEKRPETEKSVSNIKFTLRLQQFKSTTE